MITIEKGHKVHTTDMIVVTGGDFNEEDNVLVVNGEGVESYLQAYYIQNGVVYDQRNE